MKAVVFEEHGGPDRLIYKDVPSPRMGSGEVLIRVKACALNHLDIWVRQGIPAYQITLPHISGCDISGVIEEVGGSVQGFSIGDRVLISPGQSCFECPMCFSGNDNLCQSYSIIGAGSDGGYAEFVKAPGKSILPIPISLTFEEAAAFPLTFLTSWHMLMTRAQLRIGEVVLVLGAGSGIGSAAIQIAKLGGAKVITTGSTEEKLRAARELGADEVIHSVKEDFSQRTKELTHGRGADIVFEHVGSETWDKSLSVLAKGGRLVTCGATSGPKVAIDIRFLFSRQLSLLGSMMGTRKELLDITRLVGERKLRPVMDQTFPLREARQAQERMVQRSHFGKIVLVP
ncbi:MAG TPA: zinc-binding dehydrogenase [Nitrospiria bacterium]